MAEEIDHARALNTKFMFTKLVVHDLTKAAEFYASVCGLVESHRLDAEIEGRVVSEVVFAPTHASGPMFVLVKFHDAERPVRDEVMLGLATDDLEAFLERVKRGGGTLVDPIREIPEHGLRVAFARDLEGHYLQITQMVS